MVYPPVPYYYSLYRSFDRWFVTIHDPNNNNDDFHVLLYYLQMFKLAIESSLGNRDTNPGSNNDDGMPTEW